MSVMPYVISYRTLPSIERAARRTMVDHLDREQAEWKPFLDLLGSGYGEMQIPASRQAMTGRQLAAAFDPLRAMLNDPDGFGRGTADSFRRTAVAPSPGESMEGRLVLGLHAAGRTDDAVAAYARFVSLELAPDHHVQRPVEDLAAFLKRGETLLAAGHVAAALPTSKLASSGISTSRARAQELLASLDGQVAEAAAINEEHAAGLSGMRDMIAAGILREAEGALPHAAAASGARSVVGGALRNPSFPCGHRPATVLDRDAVRDRGRDRDRRALLVRRLHRRQLPRRRLSGRITGWMRGALLGQGAAHGRRSSADEFAHPVGDQAAVQIIPERETSVARRRR